MSSKFLLDQKQMTDGRTDLGQTDGHIGTGQTGGRRRDGRIRQMDGWTDGRTEGPTDGRMDRRTDGPMDRPTDGRTDRPNQPMDQQADRVTYRVACTRLKK